MTVEFIFSLLPAGESESSASSESGSESGSWTSRSDDSTATSSEVEIIEDPNAPSPEVHDHDDSPGSDAEGGVSPMPLFSYVCTVALDWIADEALTVASRYTGSLDGAFREIETLREGEEPNYRVICPSMDERICSRFEGDGFAMYEYVFKELGFRLPFSDFQKSMMAFLNLAPSQLHPNAFAFMRAFEIVCSYLGIGATTALFGRCFRVQRQAANGRYSWVSFRNAERKLFGMYTDSVKGFKDRYFVVQPLSRRAYSEVSDLVVMRDEDGEVLRDEDGHVMRELCTRFPFFWWKGHFSSPPKHYVWEDDDLDDQDRESYSVLCKYVDSFTMSRWVTRNGDLILDEEGVPCTEQRPINTKALLACRTPEETWTLLGCVRLPCFVISVRYFANLFYFFFAEAMPEKEDNILKQALDARRKKKNQGTGAGENSGSAGSPHKTHADERSTKRSRPSEGVHPDQLTLGPGRAFVFPPCYKDGGYFEKLPLSVSPDEARGSSDMGSSSLQKQLGCDGAAVMRVLGMAQVLASGGSGSTEALKEAEAGKKVGEDKMKTMETE